MALSLALVALVIWVVSIATWLFTKPSKTFREQRHTRWLSAAIVSLLFSIASLIVIYY